MNNQIKFLDYRKKFPTFIYDSYSISNDDNVLIIKYKFIIEGLTTFNPTYEIDKKNIKNCFINNDLFNYLIFHIGLVELISYFKCTCSPNVIIKAGYINEEQQNWFKKLSYYGLSEMLYKNNITTDLDSFMNISCTADKKEYSDINYKGTGNLIPIGGGKDSCVSLELLKNEFANNTCFAINAKDVTKECCKTALYNDDNCFFIKRNIDKKLIELNNLGYLNGHTPFSSLVAFVSYLAAYLSCKKYIVLSNEGSANEPTILGTKINHQYSKTFEFEEDFNNYTLKYFNVEIKYFSLLRPLNEFQIGMLFSHFKKYHKVFKSCNVGSKEIPWKWCCECPKCLFVYIILSPFLYKDELINIFGCDLYENKNLLNTFIDLLGFSTEKPFECVGMYGEVRYAVSLLIKNIGNNDLPYLLKYYKDNYELELSHDYRKDYNLKNNLNQKFEEVLKKYV